MIKNFNVTMKYKITKILFICIFLSIFAFIKYLHTLYVHDVSQFISQDKKWLINVAVEEYVSIFSPPEYIITLEPTGGILKEFRAKRLLEMGYNQDIPIEIIWKDSHHVNIITHSTENDIILQVLHYKDVDISYDVVLSAGINKGGSGFRF